jgi:dolichol-phosphate mannosyltransferase
VTSEDWPLIRRIISWGATALAKPLTSCSDPMSGFFALPRSTFERAKYLNPTGYKIGLELMVRCKCQNIVEVPIQFRDREAGESKLTMKQNLLYLAHLARLYWFVYPKLVISFITLMVCAMLLFLYLVYAFVIAPQ